MSRGRNSASGGGKRCQGERILMQGGGKRCRGEGIVIQEGGKRCRGEGKVIQVCDAVLSVS